MSAAPLRLDRRRLLVAGGAGLATALSPVGPRAQTDSSAKEPNGSSQNAQPRLVMWGAALMAHPLQERLEAVAASGFTHMTVFPADMKRWRSEGLTDAEITRAIRASGVRIATIDPYTGWVPGWSLDRRVPGEGAFDLARTIAVLRGMGPLRSIGPETFSAEMNELSAAEAVRRNAAGLHGLMPELEGLK